MKKILLILISVMLLLSLCALTACNDDPDVSASGGSKGCEHQWREIPVPDGGNCAEAKQGMKECTICHASEPYTVPAGTHTMEIYEQRAATCSLAGYVRERCTVCGHIESTDLPGGHTYAEWKVGDEPTMNYDGFLETTCTRCEGYFDHELPKFSEGEYVKETIDEDTFSFKYVFEGKTYTFQHSNFEFMGIDDFLFVSGYNGTRTELVLPVSFNGKPVIGIDNHAFWDNTDITKVVIPSGYTAIGEKAFCGCTSLASVEFSEGIVEIGDQAFFGCPLLTSITLPNTVETIGERAFEACLGLTEINFGTGLKVIEKYAFASCGLIEEIALPSGVEQIGKGVFYGLNSLAKLTVPSVSGVDNYGYKSYYFGLLFGADSEYEQREYVPASLKEVVINGNVTAVGVNAFAFIPTIRKITLPDTVESIGNCAFDGCTALSEINIPKSLRTLGRAAFRETGLFNSSSVNVEGKGYYLGNDENPYVVLLIVDYLASGSFSVNESTVFIYDEAFSYASDINEVVIPASVKSIGQEAFYTYGIETIYFDGDVEDWCNLTIYPMDTARPTFRATSIYFKDRENNYYKPTEIEIPESITVIPEYCFFGFRQVESFILHSGITEIGSRAFHACDGLESIMYRGTVLDWCGIEFSGDWGDGRPMDQADHFMILNDDSGFVEIQTLKIPDGITSIGSYQFYGFNGIMNLYVPRSVTYIHSNAFGGCDNLNIVYYAGTYEEFGEISSSLAFEPLYLRIYSADMPTMEMFMDARKNGYEFWHYASDGSFELYDLPENKFENKSFVYSSTTVSVSDEYWAMLDAANKQGYIEEMLDSDMLAMYRLSGTKADFESILSSYYSRVGDNLSLSFGEGEILLSQNGEQTSLEYAASGNEAYYVLTGGLAFTLDEANGRIYEYIAPNEYFTVYHYYTLVQ